MNSSVLLTTSWDDGSVEDLRLAEMIARHSLGGTFYIPRECIFGKRLSVEEIRELASIPGVEVGAHTISHANLRDLSVEEVRAELVEGKDWLQDILGEEVRAFCYPMGKFRRWMIREVAKAGYVAGRTTMNCRMDLKFNPLCMPTTVQVYPHSWSSQMRHALLERNLRATSILRRPWKAEDAPSKIVCDAVASSSVAQIHVWGHSWEVDNEGLWELLDQLLVRLAGEKFRVCTNGELASEVWRLKGVGEDSIAQSV